MILCRLLGLHRWEWCGRFVFCHRCGVVNWWTGRTYWELDVCDTREQPELVEVVV